MLDTLRAEFADQFHNTTHRFAMQNKYPWVLAQHPRVFAGFWSPFFTVFHHQLTAADIALRPSKCYPTRMGILFGILFLVANLACLGVLLWRRYWSLYPLFVALQAVTCWQAFARLYVVVDQRETWTHYWAPGEYWLLVFTGVAVAEAVWESFRKMPLAPEKVGVLAVSFLAGLAVVWLGSTAWTGDWYDRLLSWRRYGYLAFATTAWCSWFGGLRYNKIWPRPARMHSGILAALMGAHVLIAKWTPWPFTNIQYRIAEGLCLAGLVINAGFLRQDFGQVPLAPYRERPAPPRTPRTASQVG